MRSHHLLLGLIFLTLLVTCLAAAAKLRATPKYDRIREGMTFDEVGESLGVVGELGPGKIDNYPIGEWVNDEGTVTIQMRAVTEYRGDESLGYCIAVDKTITRRGPLERLAWLAGWR